MAHLSKSIWRPIRLLTIVFVFAQLSVFVARANISYSVDTTITSANPTGNPLQSDTVLGSITTDGTIGVIGASDVLGWNLQLIDNLNAANDYTLTPTNSALVEDVGSALTATSGGLFFNYGGTGEFLIQANSPGAYSGYRYFCFSTGVFACAAGESISPQYIFSDGVVATGSSAPVGNQPLDESATPEPSYLVPLLAMLGVCVAVRRKVTA